MTEKSRGRPVKFIHIAGKIAENAFSPGAGAMLKSERKLAQEHSCTQITIRRALKYLENQGLIRVEPGRGCFPVAGGNGKNDGNKKFAALIFPDNELFYYQVFSVLEPLFAAAGRYLTVHLTGNSPQSEKNILDHIRQCGEYAAVIAVPCEECVEWYQKLEIPVVFFDVWLPGSSVPTVVSDDFNGATEAVKNLIALGHNRIAFIGNDYEPSGRARKEGYLAAMRHADLPLQSQWVQLNEPTREWGFEAMKVLLELEKAPTAVFCVNDTVCAGAMRLCHKKKIRIPDQMSFCGFGNTETAQDLYINSVEQNIEKIVESVFENLKLLQNGLNAPVKTVIPCTLIQRSSVGRV